MARLNEAPQPAPESIESRMCEDVRSLHQRVLTICSQKEIHPTESRFSESEFESIYPHQKPRSTYIPIDIRECKFTAAGFVDATRSEEISIFSASSY